MKKKNSRFIGTILAISMIFTLIAPAHATETLEDEQLSEFAGASVICEVISTSDDGDPISYIIEVPIPEDATKSEEDALVRAAVLPQARYPFDTLYSGKLATYIVSGFNLTVAECAITKSDYATFIILFEGLSPFSSTGAGDLSVTVTSSKTGTTSNTMTTSVSTADVHVYMTNGINGVMLPSGSTMTVTATTTYGAYSYTNCEVWATLQAY